MKKFKKLVALVLAFAMVLSMNTMAFAANFSDVTDADQVEAVALMSELGVINGYPDGTFKPSQVVTRAEMAKMVVEALGYGNLAGSSAASFTDTAGHWANGHIALANGLGIVIGYPDGSFKPNAVVSYDEAATMVVRALGYTDDSLTGVWPANYLVKAVDLDVFDNTDMVGTGATRGNVAIMLFNVATKNIGTVNADDEWVASSPAATFLTRNDDVAEWGPAVVEQSTKTTINIQEWVGVYASGYTNEDGELILLKQEESVLTGEFNDDATEFTADGVDYEVTTSDALKFFVNADDATSKTAAELADKTVTLSAEVDGDTLEDIYAANEWVIEEAAKVTDEQMEDDLEDNELLGFAFYTDDDEIDADTFVLVGVDSLEDIEEDDVVYVYTNDANKIRKVAVGTEQVYGNITRVSSDKTDFTVDGVVYELAETENGTQTSTSYTADADKDIVLYLDAYGDIYLIEDDEDTVEADTYAIVLKSENGEPGGIEDDEAQIKLLLGDGSTAIFNVVDDSVLDADLDFTAAVTAPGTFVEYGLDDDGDIDVITLAATGVVTTAKEVFSNGVFDGKYIASNALIFMFDDSETDKSDDDNYDIVSAESIEGDEITAEYVVDGGKIVAMAIWTSDAGAADMNDFGVVNSYAVIDNGTKYELTMMIDGSSVVLGTDEDAVVAKDETLELYEVEYNTQGEVTSLAVLEAVTGAVMTPEIVDGMIGDYTISNDVVVYIYDTDKEYSATNTYDVDEYKYAYLYDLPDSDDVSDGLIDVIILWEEL